MDNLAVKHGYYYEVDRNDEEKYMHVIIGKAYRNDDVESFTIKSENGFLAFYINDKREVLRDQDLSNSFEDLSDAFLEKIAASSTKVSLMRRVNDDLVPYYDEEN